MAENTTEDPGHRHHRRRQQQRPDQREGQDPRSPTRWCPRSPGWRPARSAASTTSAAAAPAPSARCASGSRAPRTNFSQGVTVEVGERQAAIDVDLVADFGVAIADLAAGVRRNVITSVERMTGLEVTEVNITVHDVHLESDDDGSDGEPTPSRVQ